METKDPSQNTAGRIAPVSLTDTTLYLDRDEIARCVRRAESERAAFISANGRKMWRTIASLWQQPPMIPSTYKTS